MFCLSICCVTDYPKLGDLSSNCFPGYCDLYIRNEGRAQLGDSSAPGDSDWDVSMVSSQWWAVLEGPRQLDSHPWLLGRDGCQAGLHGPLLLHVASRSLHIVSPRLKL